MFGFFNIFKTRNKKIKEKAFQLLRQASKISKEIEFEKDQVRLRGLAFDLKKAHDEGLKLLDDINYDKNKLDKIYFDPKTKMSENFKKVEQILQDFNSRI
ncbi:MAG: hypothetical protein CMI81_04045 [Candidatus Pelagibacter sp.]|nr:hypothetical protein [Candidatus Pelagibacter sp.]OUV96417.1 MAG: hypothetical protein CBD02_05020 [Candidatus Pelagibacter sp. TMED142]